MDQVSGIFQGPFYLHFCNPPGIPEKFSGHSFRISTATLPAQRGVLDHLIKTMGRWSSEAYILYVCTPMDTILWVAGRIS